MRSIDADKLTESFYEEGADIYADFGEEAEWGFSYELVRKLIVDAPTVDATPVVRCADCEYYRVTTYDQYCANSYGLRTVYYDTYCPYGKKVNQ